MNCKFGLAFAVFTFMAVLVSAAVSVQAADACKTYADTAVSQHLQNQANDCGFSGLRWQSDHGAHEFFCRLAGSDKADSETQIRQRDLERCSEIAAPQNNQDAPAQEDDVPECKKSEIAEGKGASQRDARDAAHTLLAAQRAQMMHDGYQSCLYRELGCSGPAGGKVCFMSVTCCLN